MKLAVAALLLAACHHRRLVDTAPPPPPPAPTPTASDLRYLAAPAVVALRGAPVACPAGAAPTPDPPARTCAPHVLATGKGGALVRAWELRDCQVGMMRAGDGAVQIVTGPDHVYAIGEPTAPPIAVASQRAHTAIAAGAAFDLLLTKDATAILGLDRGARCEQMPVVPSPAELAGAADGRLYLWTRDAAGTHLVERTLDGTYHVFPALDAALGTLLFEQGGKVALGYRTATELGYFDDVDHHLHPIRRDAQQLANVQLVAGAAATEPPTAMWEDGDKLVVAQPDPERGWHELARPLKSKACARGGDAYAGTPPPASDFDQLAPPALMRTAAGGLFVAYGESRGTCTYKLERGYGGAFSPPRRLHPGDDPTLVAHPPPPPPEWRAEAHVTSARLVLLPIVGGRFDQPLAVELPPRALGYTGPWAFHPAVRADRIRIAIGDVFVDLDPAKLPAAQPLATPWPTAAPPPPEPAPRPILALAVEPPPQPLPPLRVGDPVAPLALAPQATRTVTTPPYSTCAIAAAASPQPGVTIATTIRCDQARALDLAAAPDGRAEFTLFSQRGAEPVVDIGARGEVAIHPRDPRVAYANGLRFERGAFVLGPPTLPGAPPPPPSAMLYPADATHVFQNSFDAYGGGLQRGHVDNHQWVWEPAFPGGRTPPKGSLWWPVFLPHAGGDPTIVFVGDPRDAADIQVRTPAGAYVALPTWGKGTPGDYRVDRVAAVELPKRALPLVAARIDRAIVVGWPASDTRYEARALVGLQAFDREPPPPPGAGDPHPTPRGLACSDAIGERAREEVYSPQVFAWGAAGGLAYLSTRVVEQLRWAVVPGAAGGAARCGWVVDRRQQLPELALARVDGTGAREVVRVPVDYVPGAGFHGSSLAIDRQGTALHAVATSYGHATYVRFDLGKL